MSEYSGGQNGTGLRFAVVVARFNSTITEELLTGARDCLVQHGVSEEDIDIYRVPGAWELPQAAARIAARERHDGIIAIGCVIRGETPHFDYVSGEASYGLGSVARAATMPLTFGVLTTDTIEQAFERAGGSVGNKGWDAALAALEMVDLFRQVD